MSINARVCEEYERVARAARDAGWEFMGHAWEQMPIHRVEDQKAMIEQSLDMLERFTGERPVGWLGPGLTETEDTPELLAAAGIKYIGDWVYDDEPTEIHTANGPLVTLPYTVELNDIPMMLVQHHESAYFTQRCIDSFDRLYREGAERAKIMAIAIHPYISGQPHRIKYLEAVYDHINRYAGVLHWNGVEILDWYMSARAEADMAEPIMLPTERLDYSAIAQRPKLVLPDGARLVVWVIVNVEEWDPRETMPRTVMTPPAGGAPMPDIPNWAWHEYGNRVGFWRMLEVLDEHRIRAVLADQRLCDHALRADRPRRARPRLGIHRPRLHAKEHAEGRRRARRHPQDRRGDPRVHRQEARAAGSAPALPRPGRRPTCWSRRVTTMSATGCSTTSP